MYAALRAQYLQRLGVVTYVPRDTMPKTPDVHWEGPKDASLIFLFQSPDTHIDWSLPAYQLLKKIMDAVVSPGISMALCWSSTTPITLPHIVPQASLVSFGRGLTQSESPRTIHTVPLGALQHSDAEKRALWQALKAMKAIYGC